MKKRDHGKNTMRSLGEHWGRALENTKRHIGDHWVETAHPNEQNSLRLLKIKCVLIEFGVAFVLRFVIIWCRLMITWRSRAGS